MPEYLYYTVDDNGEPSRVIGMAEGDNSQEGITNLVSELVTNLDQPLTNVRAVRYTDEYSTQDIEQGKV